MPTRARAFLLLAVPAVFLGVAAAIVAGGLEPPPSAPGPASHSGAAPADVPEASDADAPEARPRNPRERARAGSSSRRRLDPAVTAQLSDPDPAVRDAAALSLLRMGTGILNDLHYVQPKNQEGAALLSRMEIALGTLRAIELGGDYGQLTADSVLELRLKYWKTVVPESSLCEERLAHWNARVAGDEQRIKLGAMTSDEAALDALDLLVARADCGEIDAETLAKERGIHLPGARRFVASLAQRQDLGKDRVAEYTGRLAAIERR